MSALQTVEQFADCRIVGVTIPLRGHQPLQVDGVLRQLTPPLLEIQFPTLPLPLDNLDPSGTWRITFDKGVAFLTVWAELLKALNSHHVQLTISGSESNTHTRRDHRIDTEIYLRYWQGGENQGLKPARTRVNLSGYGISFKTKTVLPEDCLVEMELILPGATLETIRCLGRVIRSVGEKPGPFETAFELLNISQDDMEKVIHFSMTEQFKNMQNKTRILAATFQPSAENPTENP